MVWLVKMDFQYPILHYNKGRLFNRDWQPSNLGLESADQPRILCRLALSSERVHRLSTGTALGAIAAAGCDSGRRRLWDFQGRQASRPQRPVHSAPGSPCSVFASSSSVVLKYLTLRRQPEGEEPIHSEGSFQGCLLRLTGFPSQRSFSTYHQWV